MPTYYEFGMNPTKLIEKTLYPEVNDDAREDDWRSYADNEIEADNADDALRDLAAYECAEENPNETVPYWVVDEDGKVVASGTVTWCCELKHRKSC